MNEHIPGTTDADTVPSPARERGSFWRSVFPPAQWLRTYQPRWLPADAVAGATLAAYAIPVSLAYATLAGLPPQHGIYCYLFGGLLYACFGSSRQLAIGPTSAISMLVGTTVAGMAGGDPARWVEIAALSGLVFAAICGLAWLLSLSSLVNFISETVLLGFKAGAAITIAMTQLPKLLGVPGGGEGFFERVAILAGQLGQTNLAVLCFGLVAIALLVAGERFLPGRPVALLVVVLSIVLLSVTPLAELGFTTVGLLPSGLPALDLPELRVRDVDGVIPLAFACFLLAYIEGISAARTLAQKNGYEIDPRQELLALGAANLAASFGQGYPVAGGLSQSSVNDKAGAKTPLALVFASAVIALCLLFLTGLLRNLPNVILAAIVLVAVAGLIKVHDLRRLWRVRRAEFAIAMVALVGVLLLGILKGVIVAAIMSLAMLLRDMARPHVAVLGRIPGTRRYSDLERHPDNERVPGLLIVRVEAPLLYFNANYVRDTVRQHLKVVPEAVRAVIFDLSTSPTVDVTAGLMLGSLQQELAAAGIQLRFANAHAAVRDFVRAGGGEARIGEVSRKLSLDGVVQSILAEAPGSRESMPAS